MLKKGLKAAVFVSNPKGIYSGGRYYALMLTEALAELGVETYYVTNMLPIFWQDMTVFPNHKDIQVVVDFAKAMEALPSEIDFSFIVPGTSDPKFYDNAIECSMVRNARISLINFESHNWFNKYAEESKTLEFWDDWKKVASASSLVLSISEEGSKYARPFYQPCAQTTLFEHCYPPINSQVANQVDDLKRENRILLFARFQGAAHKGGERVVQILNEQYSGWKLTIVVGTGIVPDFIKNAYEKRASQFGIELEWKYKISDKEKFELYKSSKILLFPSFFEGFGYPPIEARYCGCKVVAFYLPVLEETCGSDIIFAKHGDWDDFADKVTSLIISNNFAVSGERLSEVAPFSAMAKKLGQVLLQLEKITPDYSVYSSVYTNKSVKTLKSKAIQFGESILIYFAKKLRSKFSDNSGQISYFPKFPDQEALNNHYYRAAWYFPYKKNLLERVFLYVFSGVELGKCPEHMSCSNQKTQHIKIETGRLSYLIRLLTSDVVLLWDSDCHSWWLKILKLCGITIINVDTDDTNSKEYGVYPGIIWRNLLTAKERKKIIDDSYHKFCDVAVKIKLSGKRKAAVFGTAPSLENAVNYNFDNCLGIICNSTVQNKALLEHIKPTFVTAGDAVSHFGVSTYADVFRKDLCKAIKEHDLYYFGTVTFGYFLTIHYPELADNFIFIEQKTDGPNFNLLENYSAPKLDSTMNIHMLPLAATFARDVYVLGCDGKDPDEKKNEDFWAHATSAQYHSLVDTGHKCHPTFDLHRQVSTYSGYVNSVIKTLNTGNYSFGIRYTSLYKSYVPGFKERHLTEDWYDANNIEFPIGIEKLSDLLVELDDNEGEFHCDSELETKLAISSCVITGSEVVVKGWFLTPYKYCELKIAIGDTNSYIFNRLKRPDLAAKFPEYSQDNVGFEYRGNACSSQIPEEVEVTLVNGTDLLSLKRCRLKRVEVS